MSVRVLYRTQARATGGRDGYVESSDGDFRVKLSTPKELGGSGGSGNNPEQLFAAGYAACFLSAMKAVAAKDPDVRVPADSSVTATVGIGPLDGAGFGLSVALSASLPGMERTEAIALVAKAHEVCPYSNAIRGNVEIRLSVA